MGTSLTEAVALSGCYASGIATMDVGSVQGNLVFTGASSSALLVKADVPLCNGAVVVQVDATPAELCSWQ
jgi:hypothetical protein